MSLSCFRLKYIFLIFLIIFIIGCIFSFITLSKGDFEKCNCSLSKSNTLIDGYEHLLGIIVPFRDRFDELVAFLPHINEFLTNQSIAHRIFIINQVDDYRFNRASLINVGFNVATSAGCDYIAMHDVDLLPLNPQLSYFYPSKGVFHIASPQLHPRYHYSNFIGGILLINKKDYIRVNGMSNRYWGWGLEDDEFYVRVKSFGIPIIRPLNITTGVENTFKHIHSRAKRKRDTAKCYNQKEITRRRDRETGLDTLNYKIVSKHDLIIDGVSASVINTKLYCNKTATPWCNCPTKSSDKNL